MAMSMTGYSLATDHLLRAVTPRIRSAVRAVLGPQDPAFDDAIQLALIRFVEALPAYRGECDPMGYAHVIAMRTALGARRQRQTSRSRHDGEANLDAFASEHPSPSDAADADRQKRVMHDLLAELPREQAEALALRIGLGWSLEEVARETGAPLNTVRSRLRLAKERLRERIEGDAMLRELFERG